MTHYFLYIKAGAQIDSDTRFYKVGVGESEAQERKRLWLQAFAHEHGHFFVKWSMDAVEFVTKCRESLGDPNFPVSYLMAVDLIRILRTGCEEPASITAEMNRHNLLMQIDPHYYFYYNLHSKKTELG